MAGKKIKIDFDEMWKSIKNAFNSFISYFKHLTTDLIIAYIVLVIGVAVLIVAFCL